MVKASDPVYPQPNVPNLGIDLITHIAVAAYPVMLAKWFDEQSASTAAVSAAKALINELNKIKYENI